jgi:hypothetical protein
MEYDGQQFISNSNRFENIASKDPGFMQWFLQVENDVKDLVNQWRGFEKNDKGIWIKTRDSDDNRIMNERGVKECERILRSCMGRAMQASNYDSQNMNFAIREWVIHPTWESLEAHYFDYEFRRGVDMTTVGTQICRLAHAILLGARANGYRQFLTQTHQVSEVRTNNEDPNSKRGMFSNLGNIFRRQTPQEQYYSNGGNM